MPMLDQSEGHKKEKDTLDKGSNSGFTEELDKEMNMDEPMPIETAYSNLYECYVSKTGHTRLFSATKYGKRYILKCLKKDFLYTPIYQQALTKEFEIGLQLEHPNICHTLGIEQIPEMGTTIVMEYIDGDTLQSLIDRKLLTTELAHNIVAQLMDALEYMHSKQIIHRDLKPSNIMVTHTGQTVKIIDFGLSDSDAFYVLKLPAGTSGYIAPEQLLPEAKAEPRADIYSLGKVVADMAKATGAKSLKRMAAICTLSDTHRRPNTIEKLRKLPIGNSHYAFVIAILSLLILGLSATICYIYQQRNQAQEGNLQQEQTLDGDSIHPKANQVIDYQLWDH